MANNAQPHIEATYSAPNTSSKAFSAQLPALAQQPSTEDKTSYLSALGASTKQMQSEINDFLTAKMEEDKKNENSKGEGEKERKEEEMYGEEGEE